MIYFFGYIMPPDAVKKVHKGFDEYRKAAQKGVQTSMHIVQAVLEVF